MENPKKLSLEKEIEKEIEQIEKEIENHPELNSLRVTEEMDAALFEKIREYEREQAENRTITVRKRPKRKIRWVAALAAVLVLALGLGMTSVGSKSYWKELLDVLMGEESARVINVEDMEKQTTEDIDEIQVYQEIDEKLGADLVWMRYKPKGMILERYSIDESIQMARIFFRYQDNLIRYTMYGSREDSSWVEKNEDRQVGEYIQCVNGVEIEIAELEKPDQAGIRRVARFEYKGMHYELKGVLEKAELEKILENLYFL